MGIYKHFRFGLSVVGYVLRHPVSSLRGFSWRRLRRLLRAFLVSGDGDLNALTPKFVDADKRIVWPDLKPLGVPEASNEGHDYGHMLSLLHGAIRPTNYLEIGIYEGSSLSLARCPSVGVDPDYRIAGELQSPAELFRMESDAFFADTDTCQRLFSADFELAFIDGMHLAEYVLRDFINVERHVSPSATVVIDDVLPEQHVMALRDRQFNAWCGDVYKLLLILQEYRPELDVKVYPAMKRPYRKGLAVIRGLDPSQTSLTKHYEEIVKGIHSGRFEVKSIEELESRLPVRPMSDFRQLLEDISAESTHRGTAYENALGDDREYAVAGEIAASGSRPQSPVPSRLWLGLSVVGYVLRRPVSSLRGFSWLRLRRLLKVFLGDSERDLDMWVRQRFPSTTPASLRPVELELGEELDDLKLHFDDVQSPLVSIVLPVYNEYRMTIHCLRSLLDSTVGSDTAYELISCRRCLHRPDGHHRGPREGSEDRSRRAQPGLFAQLQCGRRGCPRRLSVVPQQRHWVCLGLAGCAGGGNGGRRLGGNLRPHAAV